MLKLELKNTVFECLPKIFKKLVSVLAISALRIRATQKDNWVLEKVSYIYYSVLCKKDKIKALINLSSEVNTMILTYAAKLGLEVCHINVAA